MLYETLAQAATCAIVALGLIIQGSRQGILTRLGKAHPGRDETLSRAEQSLSTWHQRAVETPALATDVAPGATPGRDVISPETLRSPSMHIKIVGTITALHGNIGRKVSAAQSRPRATRGTKAHGLLRALSTVAMGVNDGNAGELDETDELGWIGGRRFLRAGWLR